MSDKELEVKRLRELENGQPLTMVDLLLAEHRICQRIGLAIVERFDRLAREGASIKGPDMTEFRAISGLRLSDVELMNVMQFQDHMRAELESPACPESTREYYDWVKDWLWPRGNKPDYEQMSKDRMAYLKAKYPGRKFSIAY